MANTSGPLTDGCFAHVPRTRRHGWEWDLPWNWDASPSCFLPMTPGTGRQCTAARGEQNVIICGEDVKGHLPRGAEMPRCGLNRLEDPYGFGGIDGLI